MCSFKRPGVLPERLVMDFEYRTAYYHSNDGKDHPEKLLYAFDLFEAFTLESFIDLYKQITSGEFKYNMLGIDNATMFQQYLLDFVQTQADARTLAKAFRGVYAQNRLFIETRFRATDAGGIYTLIKTVIGEFSRALRGAGIDVIITAQAHNVWENYGTKSAKILGQTAHLHAPWLQFADLVYMLSRSTTSADKKRTIQGAPRAAADPFAPKASIVGAPTSFTLSTWKDFWGPVTERLLPTEEDWADVVFDEPQQPEYVAVAIPGPVTLKEAKETLADLAVKHGLMRAPKDGEYGRKMVAGAAPFGLTGANMLERYSDWVLYIEARAEGKLTKEEFAAILEAKAVGNVTEEVKETTLKAEAKAAAAKALAAKKAAPEAGNQEWLIEFVDWAGHKGLGIPEVVKALSAAEGVKLDSISATSLSHGEAKAAVDAYIAANLAKAKANLETLAAKDEKPAEAPHPAPEPEDVYEILF